MECRGSTDYEQDDSLAMTPMIALVSDDQTEAHPVTPVVEMLPNGLLVSLGPDAKPIFFSYMSALHFSEILAEGAIVAMTEAGVVVEVDAEDEEYE